MKIAVGNSRMDKKWKNREISWEELCQKVSTTIRTTETVEEYRKLKKALFFVPVSVPWKSGVSASASPARL